MKSSLSIFDKIINYYQSESEKFSDKIPEIIDEKVDDSLINETCNFIKSFDISKFNYDEQNRIYVINKFKKSELFSS